MTELSREARAVLDAARDQYNPTAADKARVLAKVKVAAAAAPAAAAVLPIGKIALASAALLAVGLAVVAAKTMETSATNSAPTNATNSAAPEHSGEVELLRAARIALRDGDNTRALELTAEHERLYNDSALSEERWATSALAACALGQYHIAQQAIAALTALAPSSEHLARINRACANKNSQPPQETATQPTP